MKYSPLTMNSEFSPETLPQPYSPIFWLLWTTILVLMLAIRRERQKPLDGVTSSDVQKMETSSIFIQRPEDLESMLLNFTLLILLAINLLGYYFHLMKLAPNEMSIYPNWLIIYINKIIIPMMMMVTIAVKILVKSGRGLQRAFLT